MEEEIVRSVLKVNGFSKLNPVQNMAVDRGLLSGKNMVIFSPTASGKTICAELVGLRSFYEGRKMVYMVPLVSLALEKYEDFKRKYSKIGVKVAISVGDYDSDDPWLKDYDWIVVSNEKMDSLIRHRANWINDIGVVVIDEIHLLNQFDRGPTLEIVITLLRKMLKAQFIALSATIKNVEEIAGWLGADKVVSDWRPVKLYKGIAFPYEINFDSKKYDLDEIPLEVGILKDTLRRGKQVLYFVSTRRSAESPAEKMKKIVVGFLKNEEKEELEKLGRKIEEVLETPTTQCLKLGECVRKGVAFHHSGLLYEQRKLVENGFRNGLIKTIVATPTLAYGVNLPSFRVVIRDVKRFHPGLGSIFIPILEVQQMMGRCGRPQYDDFGEGIIIARSRENGEELKERYIYGEPEEIESKLMNEVSLRFHVLSLISSGFATSFKNLCDFFSKTFYFYQFPSEYGLIEELENCVKMLESWGFVRSNGRLKPTSIGKRVSELYIDPYTARIMVDFLKGNDDLTDISIIYTICRSTEMEPLLNVTRNEIDKIERISLKDGFLRRRIPDEWDFEYEKFVRTVKTSLMFLGWIEEKTEEEIMKDFGVTPGDFYGRRQIAEWLLYSFSEIAKLLGLKDSVERLNLLRLRMKYGVRKELLRLVKLKDVGRVRARKLYNMGIKDVSEIKRLGLLRLERVFGPKIARKIWEQV